jgi:Arm DNA-binding domain
LKIRASKAKAKPYKLYDEKGLFLLLKPSGVRLWRFKYVYSGVEKLLALGVDPDVPLKRARVKRDEARRLVADAVDPSAKRRAEKSAQAETFAAVAEEWL